MIRTQIKAQGRELVSISDGCRLLIAPESCVTADDIEHTDEVRVWATPIQASYPHAGFLGAGKTGHKRRRAAVTLYVDLGFIIRLRKDG